MVKTASTRRLRHFFNLFPNPQPPTPKNMIRLIAIGNLGKDAVVRTSGTDSAIGFSVAVNKKYTKNGVKMEETIWLNATYWRTADQTANVAQYLKAGTLVYLEGEVKAHPYVTKGGEARAELEVRVTSLDLLGSKPEAAAPTPTTKTERKPGAMPPSDFGSDIERELQQFDNEQKPPRPAARTK